MRGAKQTEMHEILRRREVLHLRPVCPFVLQAGGGGGGIFNIWGGGGGGAEN